MLPALLLWTAAAGPVAPALDAVPAIRYFPAKLSNPGCPDDGSAPVNDFRKNWYSKHLRNAGEPSLLARTENRSGARGSAVHFTWLRSFHKPIVVRIEDWESARPHLLAVETSGQGGYGGGEAIRRIDRRLSRTEGKTLRQLWSRSNPFAYRSPTCAPMVDGAQWIIETASRGRYRFVDRQSPDDGPVREVGLALLQLTGWELGEIY